MEMLLTIMLVVIFSLLAAIHIFWGLGGRWGSTAAIPTTENNEAVMNPKMFACFVVALGLLGFAGFILVKVQAITLGLPAWLLQSGLWIISGIFIVRAIGDFKYVGFFKKIRSTTFGRLDTRYYSPLCLLIGLMGMLLEWRQ
jgi:Protein of unknown function (DUF3995)